MINSLAPPMLLKLSLYGIRRRPGELEFSRSIEQRVSIAMARLQGTEQAAFSLGRTAPDETKNHMPSGKR